MREPRAKYRIESRYKVIITRDASVYKLIAHLDFYINDSFSL